MNGNMNGGTVGKHCTVLAELAPAQGECAICRLVIDRASFCCGCGHFVCWTHGEPVHTHCDHGTANTPHRLEEHSHAGTRAA